MWDVSSLCSLFQHTSQHLTDTFDLVLLFFLVLILIQSRVDLLICFGFLPYFNVPFCFTTIFYIVCLIFSSSLLWHTVEIMIHFIMMNWPGLSAGHPRNIVLPPPCFVLGGCVFILWKKKKKKKKRGGRYLQIWNPYPWFWGTHRFWGLLECTDIGIILAADMSLGVFINHSLVPTT